MDAEIDAKSHVESVSLIALRNRSRKRPVSYSSPLSL